MLPHYASQGAGLEGCSCSSRAWDGHLYYMQQSLLPAVQELLEGRGAVGCRLWQARATCSLGTIAVEVDHLWCSCGATGCLQMRITSRSRRRTAPVQHWQWSVRWKMLARCLTRSYMSMHTAPRRRWAMWQSSGQFRGSLKPSGPPSQHEEHHRVSAEIQRSVISILCMLV